LKLPAAFFMGTFTFLIKPLRQSGFGLRDFSGVLPSAWNLSAKHNWKKF
jgi:hypothetical protein